MLWTLVHPAFLFRCLLGKHRLVVRLLPFKTPTCRPFLLYHYGHIHLFNEEGTRYLLGKALVK